MNGGGGGLVVKLYPTLATPWIIACQAPLSIGFSRQEYWSGLPFPSPGIFLTKELNPDLLYGRQILYQLSYKGSPFNEYICLIFHHFSRDKTTFLEYSF